MNIKTLSFCVFVIFICSCNKSNDALQHKTATSDSLAFYFQEANNGLLSNHQRFKYAKKTLTIISKHKNDSLNRVNYFKVANRFYNIRAYDEYRNVTELIIKNSIKENDSSSLAKAYSYLGDYYVEARPDSAYLYYKEALKLYMKLNDNLSIAKTLLNKAVVLFNEGDLIESEKAAIDALKYVRKEYEDEVIYECYNILGVISGELKDYEKSLEYHNKALSIAKLNKIDKTYQAKATSLNNIGYLYRSLEKNEQAIAYFHEALKENNIKKDKTFLYAMLKDNLAYSLFQLRETKEVPKLFYEALKIRDSLKLIPGIISSSINLSEYYSFKKDSAKSLSFAKNAYHLSRKYRRPKDAMLSLKQLSNILPKRKVIYMEEYLKINDSLQLAERQARYKLARIEYETEELEIEKDKLVSQRTIISYAGGGLIVLLLSILAFRSRRARIRELKFARQQQESNEEIYRLVLNQQQKIDQGREAEKYRIAQELHDGVMGRLSSIRLNLFVLGKKPDAETIAQCLPYINQIQEVEKEIRTITYDLERNTFSDSTSFSAVVGDIVKSIERHSGIVFQLNIDPKISWETIDNAIKMELYRILQEALQNTVKHAKAKKVTIAIVAVTDGISVEIRDDGIGFDAHSIKRGLGLQGMEHRINKIGGALQISSQPEKGTTIRLEVPLKDVVQKQTNS